MEYKNYKTDLKLKKIPKSLSILFRILVTVALVFFILYGMNKSGKVSVILSSIRSIKPLWLLTSVFICLISFIFSTWQWYLLLRMLKIKIPFKHLFGFYMIGQFFNNFLPTTWGGDFVRIYDLGVVSKEWEKVIASIVMDRLLGFYALFVIGFLFAVVFYGKIIDLKILLLIFAALITGIVIFYSFDLNSIANKIKNRNKISSFFSRLFSSLGYFQHEPKKLFYIIIIAFITQFLRIIINFFVTESINIKFPFVSFFVIIPVIGFTTALPLSISGIGIREYTGLWITQYILKEQSGNPVLMVAFTLGYIVTALVSLIGAGYFIVFRLRRIKE